MEMSSRNSIEFHGVILDGFAKELELVSSYTDENRIANKWLLYPPKNFALELMAPAITTIMVYVLMYIYYA